MSMGESGSSRRYPWIVFALTFTLMLSDFASRSVILPILPLLKSQWSLTDTQLGSLVSIIPLIVGVLTVPVSLMADRLGRVRSVTAMVLVWGLATIACGASGSFAALMLARAAIGLGEAGYGSAGGAILMRTFPSHMHSTIAGAFLSASLFGSVLGVGFGGVIATHLGWRAAFFAVGAFGVVLAVIYAIVVREPPAIAGLAKSTRLTAIFGEIFSKRAAVCAYLGFGFQSFVIVAVIAWLPSYLNRYYSMEAAEAGVKTAVLLLVSGAGTILGGYLMDRLGRNSRRNKMRVLALYALLSGGLLIAAFNLAPGVAQLALLAAGMFVAGGLAGPTVAIVTDVTNPAIHATALGMVSLFSTLLGQAPGPFLTGALADSFSLRTALQFAPLVSLLSAVAFVWGARSYENELRHAKAGPISTRI